MELNIPNSVTFISDNTFGDNPLGLVTFGFSSNIQTQFLKGEMRSVQITSPTSKEYIIKSKNSYVNFVPLQQ